jgi:glycosyltransferase involved in cell wall biosynthesis
MASYLPQCLDSVLIEGILGDIEIIVVNDGSTDASLAVANSYKERFSDSLLVIDKSNGHYGSCVNTALKIAGGKYFRILDADDRFDCGAFVKFVAWLKTCNADMVFTNYSRDYLGGGRKIPVKHASAKYANQLIVMHAITYKTEVLRDIGYRQSEGICYTDWEYCFYPLAGVKSRAWFDVVLYRYTIGREGQSVNSAIGYKNREHFYRIIRRMFDYTQEEVKNGQGIQEVESHTILHLLYHYYCLILTNTENEDDERKLREIDTLLKDVNKNLYDELGNRTYLRILKPILLWRKDSRYIHTTGLYRLMIILQRIYIKLVRHY